MTDVAEQPETFCAVSVAVAQKVVVESFATVTVMPGSANSSPVPVPATALVHVSFV